MQDVSVAKAVLSEACVLQLTHAHPHIVSLVALVGDCHPPQFVLEWAPHGNLLVWVRNHDVMPVWRAVPIMTQVASALACLHNLSIVHRDLAARNVLVFEHDERVPTRIKLADFGRMCC